LAAGFATAIDVFAMASARLYDEIAFNDFQPFSSAWPSSRTTGQATALVRDAAHQMRRSS
jgi:hypothetical protein